ncbi:MAG: hypothetical protein J5644_03755 [Bacteroidales bacterium]|nr:hypothetical protein [Bacteroidales bacterium]
MANRTKIRKDQIRIEEFIQALNSVDWGSDELTVSAAAISQRIISEIAAVAGAMVYEGEWSASTTPSSIKKGYVYVFPGNVTGSIAANQGDPAVVLEPGDLLIAKINNADPTRSSHWTIVNVNITGAITEANLVTQLVSHLASSNTNLLSIAAGTGANAGKVLLTVNFPSVSNGGVVNGQYVTGFSIDATTGEITITRKDPTEDIVVSEVLEINLNSRSIFTTSKRLKSTSLISVWVNGVKQVLSTTSPGPNDVADAIVSIDNTSHAGIIEFLPTSYVPNTGDIVVADYYSAGEIRSAQ